MLLSKGSALPKLAEARLVIVRDGTKTVLTLATGVGPGNGEMAWLVPVPKGTEAKNFNIGDGGLIEALDRYTAPRLVVVPDGNPCAGDSDTQASQVKTPRGATTDAGERSPRQVRVKALQEKARYAGGDYEINVLSPSDSARLPQWLARQGFKLSPASKAPLTAAIKAEKVFAFVKVKLPPGGAVGLRPLQWAYQEDGPALPLIFGAAALSFADNLRVYVITKDGRADIKGLKTARFPAGEHVPVAAEADLSRIYDAVASRGDTGKEGAARLEYAGDLGFCEPCAGSAPTVEELRKLGVFWLEGANGAAKNVQRSKAAAASVSGAAFVTRWRVSYDSKRLKKDPFLVFGGDKNEFQARLNARERYRPGAGEAACDATKAYEKSADAQDRAATAKLAELTGWDPLRLSRALEGKGGGGTERSWVDDLWK